MKKFSPSVPLLILWIAGCLVRLVYGVQYQPWLQAPDHLAWETMVQHGGWSYAALIHYPHEGGTLLISLFSRFISLFTSDSLVVSAFLLDSGARAVQLYVAWRVFGRWAAYALGAWLVLAAATLVPWGTVNFGLHALAAVFPFALLWLLHRTDIPRFHLKAGLFLGLAVWFAYDNLVLIPVFVIAQVWRKVSWQKWSLSVAIALAILGVHALARQVLDPGFHLDQFSSNTIRGIDPTDIHLGNVLKVFTSWVAALVGSFDPTNTIEKGLAYGYWVIAAIGFLGAFRFQKEGRYFFAVGWILVLSFSFLYSIGPFYHAPQPGENYIAYRHLAYIIPVLMLMVLAGWRTIKLRWVPVIVLIIISGIGTVDSFFQPKPQGTAVQATGWVLAQKLGHQPEVLHSIISKSDLTQHDLLIGVGWGTATALFEDIGPDQAALATERAIQLKALVADYPIADQGKIIEGVHLAFSDQVTPRLPATSWEIVKHTMEITEVDINQ